MTAFPADPESEKLDSAREAMHVLAQMAGCLKRELIAEGFDDEEAYGLTETWLVQQTGEDE